MQRIIGITSGDGIIVHGFQFLPRHLDVDNLFRPASVLPHRIFVLPSLLKSSKRGLTVLKERLIIAA